MGGASSSFFGRFDAVELQHKRLRNWTLPTIKASPRVPRAKAGAPPFAS